MDIAVDVTFLQRVPTGEPVTALAIGIYHLVAGKIEEDWGMVAHCVTQTPWE